MSEFNETIESQQILSMEPETTGYEIINSNEVDKIVSAIEELMPTIQSENIRQVLDAAADEIYGLVYTDTSIEEVEAA